MKSQVITREEAIEIMLRPLQFPKKFLPKLIETYNEKSDSFFIREFRRTTNLRLVKFYDNKYQIVWE